ncbi:hypothetical protein Vadar_003048 [Vaccinium darrowii]|uniref:Uncharacterized protein n=1 Tax=Vaccinium darrowii TaxID=229202 RepID=A0ACB7XF09_9ERIC|nr:hypothetical protein Vadar_003048 [Vaccinium darrowii]
MGYPFGSTEFRHPKLLLRLLVFIRNLISSLGVSNFLDPQTPSPTQPNHLPDPDPRPVPVDQIRDPLLPVMKFSDLAVDPPETCTVCLYDFDSGDEVQQLTNCRHVFHRSCLDPWMDCKKYSLQHVTHMIINK